jgi:hypothetical protein
MKKMKQIQKLAIALVACIIQMTWMSMSARAENPPGCAGCGAFLNILVNQATVSSGCPATFQIQIGNPSPPPGGASTCNLTNVTVGLICPGPDGTLATGTTNIIRTGLNLPQPTDIFILTNGFPCTIVTATGIGLAQAAAFVTGAAGSCEKSVIDRANAFATTTIPVTHPCVRVTKQCVSAVATSPTAVLVTFSGSVSNCGDTPLRAITVRDNQPAPNTPVLQVTALAPGAVTNFTGTYTSANICGPFTDILTVEAVDAAVASNALCSASFVTNSSAPATCTITYTPCINVTKVCSTNLLFLCNSNPSVINFSGIVSNCGNITLTNVTLADDLINGGAVFLRIASLAPGATAPWSTNMTVGPSLCNRSNIVNTVTARGTNICNLSQGVVDTDNCSFTVVCPSPALTITKGCASPIVTNIGSSLTVTGQVCNTGTIPFTSVTVSDAQPGVPVTATTNIGTLDPGQCKAYSFTYTATTCDPNHDVATAVGLSLCGNVTNTAQADCFLCCPAISIQKLVACLLPGAVCSGNQADYSSSATGVKGNTGDALVDDPAFCYIIIVRNTGHDPLTNIVISDTMFGAVGTFPGPLAVGGTITVSNLRTNLGTTTTNIATVTARCGGVHANGASVSATTNALAVVVPANIVCVKLVSVNGGTPVQTYNATDCTVQTNVVVWYAAVTNSGSAVLNNIRVIELGTGPDLLPCGAVNLTLTNVLQPGQGTGLIPLCTNVFGCVDTNIDNSIRVTATVTGASNQCAINIYGTNVFAESDCRASVRLCCQVEVLGCRVTGGGRQDDPEVCPDNVRYVTHGGQVGAPVGNSNCVVTLDNIIGNPCIHGRWTHVRHDKGGLEGNFHARYFDTLDCACLGITLGANGLWSDGITEDGQCNPGDRIAGPEPRKAPANKIVFTGVGDWADPNGRREPRSVLFRVDIEDRSEPGGFHPGGAKDPPDRYRIRIWVLTPAEAARLANPSDGLLDFRNCIAACNGLKFEDGVLAADIANHCGGAGTLTFPGGCPVRLPDIDDGGALKNGNHQIHPQIKACP